MERSTRRVLRNCWGAAFDPLDVCPTLWKSWTAGTNSWPTSNPRPLPSFFFDFALVRVRSADSLHLCAKKMQTSLMRCAGRDHPGFYNPRVMASHAGVHQEKESSESGTPVHTYGLPGLQRSAEALGNSLWGLRQHHTRPGRGCHRVQFRRTIHNDAEWLPSQRDALPKFLTTLMQQASQGDRISLELLQVPGRNHG